MNPRPLMITGMRLLRGAAVIYVFVCLAALLLILAAARSWFGLEPDPFVAIYAVALSLPWVLLIPDLDMLGGIKGAATLILGMLINLALLLGLVHLLGRWARAHVQRL